MVIDERAYTAIKTVTYLEKRGGVSNTLATACSIGVKDETLYPILEEMSSNKLISIDERQPFPELRLMINDATAYQIISTVSDITSGADRIAAVTAQNPSPKSRWLDVYQKVQSYEGKKSKELKELTLKELAKLYPLTVIEEN